MGHAREKKFDISGRMSVVVWCSHVCELVWPMEDEVFDLVDKG